MSLQTDLPPTELGLMERDRIRQMSYDLIKSFIRIIQLKNVKLVLRLNGLSMIFLLRRYSSAMGLTEASVCRGIRSHSSRRISTSPASATLDQGSGGSGTDITTEHSLERPSTLYSKSLTQTICSHLLWSRLAEQVND